MRVWKQFRDMTSMEVLVERDLTPIAGVGFDLYAEILEAPGGTARRGVSAADWEIASLGWADRIRLNPELARRFAARAHDDGSRIAA